MSAPFLAVGADELGDRLGDTVVCPHCGAAHKVQVSRSDTSETTLEWYRCGETDYVAGLNGRDIRKRGDA